MLFFEVVMDTSYYFILFYFIGHPIVWSRTPRMVVLGQSSEAHRLDRDILSSFAVDQ